MKFEFSPQILETNAQILNFIKIRTVADKLFHVVGRDDGRTDTQDKANSPFSLFCERA
jgi:hypothetical protein